MPALCFFTARSRTPISSSVKFGSAQPDRAATVDAAQAASGSGRCQASPRRYRSFASDLSSESSSTLKDQADGQLRAGSRRPQPRPPHDRASPSNSPLPSSPSPLMVARTESDSQQLGNPPALKLIHIQWKSL